jgi:hypothetical protein
VLLLALALRKSALLPLLSLMLSSPAVRGLHQSPSMLLMTFPLTSHLRPFHVTRNIHLTHHLCVSNFGLTLVLELFPSRHSMAHATRIQISFMMLLVSLFATSLTYCFTVYAHSRNPTQQQTCSRGFPMFLSQSLMAFLFLMKTPPLTLL